MWGSGSWCGNRNWWRREFGKRVCCEEVSHECAGRMPARQPAGPFDSAQGRLWRYGLRGATRLVSNVLSVVAKIGSLLQVIALRFRFVKKRAGVGVFPEVEEVLVGETGGDLVASGGVGSSQLQVHQGAEGVVGEDAAVVDELLEFDRGGVAVAFLEADQAAQVGGIERASLKRRRGAEFVAGRDAEMVESFVNVVRGDGHGGVNSGQPVELQESALGKFAVEAVGDWGSLGGCTGAGESKGCH